ERHRSSEPFNHVGKIVERVVETPVWRRFGLSETRKIWRDEPKTVREQWYQFTEHMAGGRKAMQQQQNRRVARPCLSVENLYVLDGLKSVSGCHYIFLSDFPERYAISSIDIID